MNRQSLLAFVIIPCLMTFGVGEVKGEGYGRAPDLPMRWPLKRGETVRFHLRIKQRGGYYFYHHCYPRQHGQEVCYLYAPPPPVLWGPLPAPPPWYGPAFLR